MCTYSSDTCERLWQSTGGEQEPLCVPLQAGGAGQPHLHPRKGDGEGLDKAISRDPGHLQLWGVGALALSSPLHLGLDFWICESFLLTKVQCPAAVGKGMDKEEVRQKARDSSGRAESRAVWKLEWLQQGTKGLRVSPQCPVLGLESGAPNPSSWTWVSRVLLSGWALRASFALHKGDTGRRVAAFASFH